MIDRFALSFLCIELDRNEICEVTLVYILLLLRMSAYIRAEIYAWSINAITHVSA